MDIVKIFLYLVGHFGSLMGKFDFHQACLCLALSSDNQTLFAGLFDGQVQKLDLMKTPIVHTVEKMTIPVSSLCFLNNEGTIMALGNKQGSIYLINENQTFATLSLNIDVGYMTGFIENEYDFGYLKNQLITLLVCNEDRSAAFLVLIDTSAPSIKGPKSMYDTTIICKMSIWDTKFSLQFDFAKNFLVEI